MPHKLDGKDAGVGLNDAQRHHRMNFPRYIAGKMGSPVCFNIGATDGVAVGSCLLFWSRVQKKWPPRKDGHSCVWKLF